MEAGCSLTWRRIADSKDNRKYEIMGSALEMGQIWDEKFIIEVHSATWYIFLLWKEGDVLK
jgi:hypothetical protein